MNKSGYAALERMIKGLKENGNDYFIPDSIGLDPDSLTELSMAGVIEVAGDVNGGVYFDMDAARRFLNMKD